MTRRILQWPVFYAGLLLHAFSFHTIRTDEDTAADWHDNVSLDRDDRDGDLSDGVYEAWLRILEQPTPHNLKNYPREWLEIVHPKTAARVSGAIALGSLALGFAIGWAI
jgi:hypothetical protein